MGEGRGETPSRIFYWCKFKFLLEEQLYWPYIYYSVWFRIALWRVCTNKMVYKFFSFTISQPQSCRMLRVVKKWKDNKGVWIVENSTPPPPLILVSRRVQNVKLPLLSYMINLWRGVIHLQVTHDPESLLDMIKTKMRKIMRAFITDLEGNVWTLAGMETQKWN